MRLGIGCGWRASLAAYIQQRPAVTFVEVLAEDLPAHGPLPPALEVLRERGCQVVVHGVSLSLGSAEGLDPRALEHLCRVAERVRAPLVSEHVCFVRAGGLDSGHLLPVPRTAASLEVLVENVRRAQAALPVPLALENIASPLEWPGAEWEEPVFLSLLLEQTGAQLLLDAANLYAQSVNCGVDVGRWLDAAPLHRLAYVHAAGGTRRGGLYHDTHAHPLPAPLLPVLEALRARREIPGLMLERDDRFPPAAELDAELAQLARTAGLPWEGGTGEQSRAA
ncbi:MAG: DUF692 domain-containing protein [Deltaproteobacteria bacterium]|nr:DUF692 domain-containing protein [Deltaproteobacteria bacterium]